MNSPFLFTLGLAPLILFTLIQSLRPVRSGIPPSKMQWLEPLGCHTVPHLQEVFVGTAFSFQNGQELSRRSGVLVLSAYKGPYSKALGKDGVLVSNDSTVMHYRAAESVDPFLRNYMYPSERIDSRLMKSRDQENKHILRQIVLATEFLAKQALRFRGHRDDKVDFSAGNFATAYGLGR